MAHFCPDCKITFENRVSNCPRCGYGIANDTQSESFYINQGYTRFNHSQHTSQGVHIQDDDILNQLRGRYKSYVNTNAQTPNNTEPPVTPVNEQPRQEPSQNDFFSSFDNTRVRTPEINTAPEPDSDPIPTPEFTETPRTNNYRVPTRRVGGFGRGTVRIPWRAIIYFLLFVATIAIIINIWNMRFVILDSVLGFIGSLMPLAIIVIGVLYLLRSIFRR